MSGASRPASRFVSALPLRGTAGASFMTDPVLGASLCGRRDLSRVPVRLRREGGA